MLIDKWAYRRVMASPLWPNSSAMSPSGTPASRKGDAEQWRVSYHLKLLIRAARTAGTNQCAL